MALNNMDRRFIESNTRQAEINQSFSLAQIAPSALIELKESGQLQVLDPGVLLRPLLPGSVSAPDPRRSA